MSIGGNVTALLQVKKEGIKNAIGEHECNWVDCISLLGWLDLSTGDSNHTNFSTKIQESSHVFLCDFVSLKEISLSTEQQETVDITSGNARAVINGLIYEILLIDNPMSRNEHLEIYLKFIGGQ